MALALAAGLALTGCAAAIPIVAAGTILSQRGDKDKDKAPPPDSPKPVPASKKADKPTARASAHKAASKGPEDTSPLPTAPEGTERPLEGPVSDFTKFVMSQLERIDKDGLADSMMLVAGPDLNNPRYMPCGTLPPAVMIDLDRHEGGPPSVSVDLPRALALLRKEDVAIVWVTRAAAYGSDGDGKSPAARLHDQLVAQGLDPDRTDLVLGLRSGEDRIQQVRQDAAYDRCVLAIIGDARSDMDELFDYLKVADAAYLLEPNWGAGWFQLPAPLAESAKEGN
jgi:hypothetical protein